MRIKFCPKCHKEAFRLEKGKENLRVIQNQNGKTLVNLGDNSSCSISIGCPSGHPVKLEINSQREDIDVPKQITQSET